MKREYKMRTKKNLSGQAIADSFKENRTTLGSWLAKGTRLLHLSAGGKLLI